MSHPLLDSARKYAREHPGAAGTLCVAVFGGAAAGFFVFTDYLSPIRSVLGGAVAGFGCWLLIMVGRVIGE